VAVNRLIDHASQNDPKLTANPPGRVIEAYGKRHSTRGIGALILPSVRQFGSGTGTGARPSARAEWCPA